MVVSVVVVGVVVVSVWVVVVVDVRPVTVFVVAVVFGGVVPDPVLVTVSVSEVSVALEVGSAAVAVRAFVVVAGLAPCPAEDFAAPPAVGAVVVAWLFCCATPLETPLAILSPIPEPQPAPSTVSTPASTMPGSIERRGARIRRCAARKLAGGGRRDGAGSGLVMTHGERLGGPREKHSRPARIHLGERQLCALPTGRQAMTAPAITIVVPTNVPFRVATSVARVVRTDA